VSNIEFRIIQMFNQSHHTHIVALFVFKWERLTKSDTAWLLVRSVGRPAPTESCTLFWHNTWTWTMFEGKKWAVFKTPGWLFYYIGLLYRTSHLYGECFFLAKIRIPYDKHDKPRSPPNTSRMPLWKALFPTRRLEPPQSTVGGSCGEAETPWGLRESVYTTPGAIQDVEDLWSKWIWWETGENRPCWMGS